MGKFKVVVSRSAEKFLHRTPKKDVARLIVALQGLSYDPRPLGSIKLVGEADIFRIRVGVYRIIYEVLEETITVHVLKIGHRKDVYR